MSIVSSASSERPPAPGVQDVDSLLPNNLSPGTLLQHLLNSKRSLASINDVWRANEICNSARKALENSAVLSARFAFLRTSISSQLELLGDVHRKSKITANRCKNEFETTVQSLDQANDQLKETLRGLRDTIVEAKLRPEDEDTRNLMSFVDEKSVEEALFGTKQVLSSAGSELTHFENGCRQLEASLDDVRNLVAEESGVKGYLDNTGSPFPEILQEMDEHASEMAVNLESLVSHFDMCVTAIRHVEGVGEAASEIVVDLPDGVDIGKQDALPMSDEEKGHMMEVLQEDASQVEEVVLEIRHHITAMEVLNDSVTEYMLSQEKKHADVLTAFHSLETIGHDLPTYVIKNQAFLNQWDEEKVNVNEKLEELEGLRDFYDGFLRAYDNLIIEIGRRKAMEMRVDKLVEEASARIDKLYEEDSAERESFRKEQGDFLPVDIWPGLMSAPVKYHVLADEATVDKVPDISNSVIHRAIRRVHGN